MPGTYVDFALKLVLAVFGVLFIWRLRIVRRATGASDETTKAAFCLLRWFLGLLALTLTLGLVTIIGVSSGWPQEVRSALRTLVRASATATGVLAVLLGYASAGVRQDK